MSKKFIKINEISILRDITKPEFDTFAKVNDISKSDADELWKRLQAEKKLPVADLPA